MSLDRDAILADAKPTAQGSPMITIGSDNVCSVDLAESDSVSDADSEGRHLAILQAENLDPRSIADPVLAIGLNLSSRPDIPQTRSSVEAAREAQRRERAAMLRALGPGWQFDEDGVLRKQP